MEFFIYAIKDVKASMFSNMFLSNNHGTALRDFEYTLKSNPVQAHIASDLQLYCLGKFDSAKGALIPNDTPEFITEGSVIVNE